MQLSRTAVTEVLHPERPCRPGRSGGHDTRHALDRLGTGPNQAQDGARRHLSTSAMRRPAPTRATRFCCCTAGRPILAVSMRWPVRLADAGYQVIVPYSRCFGPTVYRSPEIFRSGQQAALGKDVIELMDALHIPKAMLAGFDGAIAQAVSRRRCGRSGCGRLSVRRAM